MRRLKIFNHLEHVIRCREINYTKMGRTEVTPYTRDREERMRDEAMNIKTVVDWRIQMGARVPITNGQGDAAFSHAQERVCQLLAHEMYSDLTELLIELEHWAYEQGYDDAMCNRLQALIRLTRGEEVNLGDV